jgi:hypothetical protein
MEFPVFTPAGQAAFDRKIPSYGRAKDSDDAKAHPEEHIGRRRAQPPALGNDTYGTCNPMGMPRAALYPDPVELIVLPDRILQHFQWGYGLRTIWMDGRTLPASEDVDIPRWWGYAVGRWDGTTLVVESTGYDERTWIDHFGYPHSDEMVLEERYTRINYDTIELKMTLTDPKCYAKPWTSETKRMHLLTEDIRPVVGMDRAARGWWHSCPAFGIVVTDRSGNDEKPIILEDRVERAGLVRDPAAGTAGRGPRRRLLAGRMANAARGRAAHLRVRDSRCQGQRRVLPELFRCHDHWLH